jgi:hypothetical protein
MAILLIQEEAEIREKLAFSLESTFGSEVKQAANFLEAVQLVKSCPVAPDSKAGADIELIIYDLGSELKSSRPKASDIEALYQITSHAPCLISQDPKSQSAPRLRWKILTNVDRTEIIVNILRSLNKFTGAGTIHLGHNEGDFCKIKTKLLLSVCPLKGDIFIRLSDTKFVKLFHEGDAFDMNDMEKYTVKKGVEYLFIKKKDVQEFIEKYNADLQKIIKSSQTLNVEEAAKLHESIYETAQELGNRVGFTKDVQLLAKSHVQLTIKQMGKSPRLSTLLEKIKSYQGEYIGSHSAIIGYMACAIASQLEWGSDVTFHKLTLAAFLHDVVLTDHKLAHCNSLDEVQKLGSAPDVVAAYKQHPILASQVARQFQEVPADVDVIILQHHERPDGTGFPRGLAHTYIAPLAMVFLVAHDMAQYFLDHGSRMDLKDFLTIARERYKNSQSRKIIEALEKLAI